MRFTYESALASTQSTPQLIVQLRTCRFHAVSIFSNLSKTSQIIFDLHPGFSHMEDEKGNKLHLFKKYFKMMCFTIQAITGPYCYSF